ncbi:MAG: acyltransferase family protein [Deltaproteobacteria bacterium]|nr:acyltransferase family protein [Deltaproteobacteria bacterium]
MTKPHKISYLKLLQGAGDSPKTENWKELAMKLSRRLEKVEREMKSLLNKTGKEPSSRPEKKPASISLMETLLSGHQLEGALSSLKSLWWGESKVEESEVDEFGMDPSFGRRVKPLFDLLYYDYWRVRVQGIQNVPADGRALIVANHSGTLPYDGAMIRLAVENDHPSRRDVRFLVEDFVYHFPFLGTFMYRIGGVRACPENAERLLKKGHLVVVFPEGVKGIGKHYKNRYRLQRFGRGGFVKLALTTGSPIIPVSVIGAEEIHPILYKSTVLAKPLGIPYLPVTPTLPLLGPLGLIPFPSKWTISFGKPIELHKQYPSEAAEDQLLVNRLSEEVRGTIQEMVMDGLKQRRSPWFG